jgi:hypothetical protein
MAQSPCSRFPLADSPCSPFYSPLHFPLLTWRPPAVTNCPPSYQVSCRLTPFAPPFAQSTDPFQAPPQNPNSSAPDNDDIEAHPLLLCGTVSPLSILAGQPHNNLWCDHHLFPNLPLPLTPSQCFLHDTKIKNLCTHYTYVSSVHTVCVRTVCTIVEM